MYATNKKTYSKNSTIRDNASLMILLYLITIAASSCKKFIEIPPPNTQLVTASVFANNASATAAQTVIYTQMANNSESWNLSQATGLLSDELTNYSTSATELEYYTNAMNTVNAPGPWTNAYNYIYQANAIIAALTNNSTLSPAVAQQLTGESLFIRAYWLFYLTNCYGDIPLVTNTNYTINADISRTPQIQVYQQIISDLKEAQNLLNSNYVDASDTTITTQRVRPTKWAATALLARVYLYTNDYKDAETEANTVITNNSLYKLCDSLKNVFLENSTEAIWQLMTPLPSSSNNATPDGQFFILSAAPVFNVANSTTISPQLFSSFETGDQRKTNWIGYYASGSDTFYYPFKYKNNGKTNTSILEYTMVLRLAEQYLIRAEAEAQLSDLSDAAADLNTIRARAGLAVISDSIASSQINLLAAIYRERRVEFFTEWGHRWFDLIRTGTVTAVMGGATGVTAAKNGTWSPSDTLYPIPQSERNLDPNLTQNIGY